jgi:hypothetical protein
MLSRTDARSSAADATVAHSPGATGCEPPYPGRSTEISLTFLALVTSGFGSKLPAPGALWQSTITRSSSSNDVL